MIFFGDVFYVMDVVHWAPTLSWLIKEVRFGGLFLWWVVSSFLQFCFMVCIIVVLLRIGCLFSMFWIRSCDNERYYRL